MATATGEHSLASRQAREARFHDELARGLDPSSMPLQAPDEWERALIAAVGDLRGARVLELGCGDGSLSLALLERGAELTAIDVSPGMVAIARARAGLLRPEVPPETFIVRAAEDTELAGRSFDVVLGKWVLHHLDLEPAATEVLRLLAPGGRAIFAETSAFNPALAWARRRVAGRAGIPSYGTSDERPLDEADLRLLERRFATVRLEFPNFWLMQMVDRHVLRYRSSRLTAACRTTDDQLARHLPWIRRYGYWMLVELHAPR